MKEVLERRKDDGRAQGHEVPHLDHRPGCAGRHVVPVRIEDLAEVALERVGPQRVA
jgi:hypothetical protein